MSSIDYGIDLGTTNSAIAVLRGVETEVVKNNDDRDTTPSAVWIDRRDRLHVGRAARERAELDPDNTCIEFKLQMGTAGAVKHFPASGRSLTPEELSAEVLRSLRGDVRQRHGTDLDAAVITVPAAFGLGPCDATRRAAELAGLRTTLLIQEPAAAAYAYGFQADDDARLMVYDLGGGTFDAAVVQVLDGEFTVLTHRGDQFLGGKLLDWQLVETLLAPAIAAEFGLADVRRGNPVWAALLGRLKLAAEAAKIRLSRQDTADVTVEFDHRGERLEFIHELHRADVERLTAPLLTRSVAMCRQALQDARLGPDEIDRVLLVGGPTLAPYLRDWLADPERGLGIPLSFEQDPITAVARGAAIFAGTQRRPEPATAAPPPGQFLVKLEYDLIGPDLEPLISGRLLPSPPRDLTGHRIELVSTDADPGWRSGLVPVGADGLFAVQAWAVRGRRNAYRLELTDPAGARQDLTHPPITYTVGVVETSPLLTYAVGVGLDDNTSRWVLHRGTPLPAHGRVLLRTTVGIHRGGGGGLLRIPLLEGEHRRADRNRQIGLIEVVAARVASDLPAGSEVQLRLDVDASRLVTARAYVPLLDEEFEHVVRLDNEEVPAPSVLQAGLRAEQQRLAEVRRRAASADSPVAELGLAQLDDTRVEQEIGGLLEAAAGDPDAAVAAGRKLLDLRAAIDAVEDSLQWPVTVADAERLSGQAGDLIREIGDHGHQRQYERVATALRAAVSQRDPRAVAMRSAELRELVTTVLDETGQLGLIILQDLKRMRAQMPDTATANTLFAQADQAAARNDRNLLHELNRRLALLLPVPPPPPDPFSTVRSG